MDPGLEGVVAAATSLSMVDGQRGELIIAGFPVEELAPNATFEQTVQLLWNADLPDVSNRQLPEIAHAILRAAAERGDDAMDALRAAAGVLLPEQLFPIPDNRRRLSAAPAPPGTDRAAARPQPRRELPLHARRRNAIEGTRARAGDVSQYRR